MHLVEEPLATRREILRSLKLGAPTSDAPFTTLRTHRMASAGWSVVLRASSGRVAGRVQMYSVLNVDAARAARLGRHDLACRLAARATMLEASHEASVLHAAADQAGIRLSAHLDGNIRDDVWSDRLTRYLDVRQAVDWQGLDREALAREWLVRSQAWLDCWPDRDELLAAVRALAAAAQTARAEETADEPLRIDCFTGVVRHLDLDCAEIVSEADEAWVVSRRELDREGLSRLGEAVTVVREELPGGGEAWIAAPAVDSRERTEPPARDPRELMPFAPPFTWMLPPDESRWLARALGREPFVLPQSPVRVAEQ